VNPPAKESPADYGFRLETAVDVVIAEDVFTCTNAVNPHLVEVAFEFPVMPVRCSSGKRGEI
jgi:hypothetical protein